MLGDDRSTTLADKRGMRNRLRVADLFHRVNDVAHILVERVVHRAVEGRAGTIVIHAEAATDIEIAEFVAHFGELRVEAGGFADGAFDGADVWHLGADMEMDKLEAVGEPGGMEHVAGFNEVGGGEAELGILAAAGGPFASALREQADAKPDEGLDFHRL